MCNISAYIGNKRAAPILVEMMKKQEGYCGGYYTGIITIDNGKLYTAKVIGDVERLITTTDALNFPGNIGIIHSRSESGGDWHWAHPFKSNDGKIAMVLNGSHGKYVAVDKRDELAKICYEAGAVFETEIANAFGEYPTLPNGHCVHTSEAVCHLTDIFYKKNVGNVCDALKSAFTTFPAEFVCLCLSEHEPDRISFAKYNMPMSIARTNDEVFLSSFAICFPKDRNYVSSVSELPHSSCGEIYLDKTVTKRFASPLEIGGITPEILHVSYERILELLKQKPCTIGDLNDSVKVLWGDKVDLRYLVTYHVLCELNAKGMLEIIGTEKDGAKEGRELGLKTMQFTVALKKE